MNEVNGIFERNIAALEVKCPAFAARIRAAEQAQDVEAVTAKTGLPTARAGRGEAKVLLHSAYNPVKEAQDMLARFDLKGKNVAFVLGLGLGYHVEELLNGYPWVHLVFLIEPNIPLLKYALSTRDLSAALNDPRFVLLALDNPLEMGETIILLQQRILTGNVVLVPHQPSLQLMQGKFDALRKNLCDLLDSCRFSINTEIIHGTQLQENVVRNMPAIMRSVGVKSLEGKFSGRPAICVNAGPSLQKNIELLREAKGRALIIAVDAVARVLLARGIEPDIIVTLDYSEPCFEHFRGIMDKTENIYLGFDPEVYHGNVREFRGKTIAFGITKPMYRIFAPFMEDKGLMTKGLCVGHTAFLLARQLGCDPIALVGQDLSYPAGSTHIAGVSLSGAATVEDDPETGKKLIRMQLGENNTLVRELYTIENIYGEQVPTDISMYSYLTYYEKLIATTDAACIQASEGGAKIRGTQIMTLREVLDRYCGAPLDARGILEAAQAGAPVDIEGLRKHLRGLVRQLKEINALADEANGIVGELLDEFRKDHRNRKKELELGQKGNKLRDYIGRKLQGELDGVVATQSAANSYLFNRSYGLYEEHLSSDDKRFRVLERMLIFYEGIVHSTEDLLKLFAWFLQETEPAADPAGGPANGKP